MRHSQRLFTIYTLSDPRDGSVRYVGCSLHIKKRFNRHLFDGRVGNQKRVSRWVGELLAEGLKPEMEKVITVPEQEWQNAEQFYIRFFRENGCNLLNSTDGGAGQIGRTVSPETRHKISTSRRYSAAAQAAANSQRGKTRSAECRANMTIAQRTSPAAIAHRKTLHEAQKKPVVCIETGRVYSCAEEAARELDIKAKAIRDAIRRGHKSHNFTWRYMEDMQHA